MVYLYNRILNRVHCANQFLFLAFNLDYYTEVLDLSYLLDHLASDPFFRHYRQLNEKLVQLIEDYSLVSFIPLNIQVQAYFFLFSSFSLSFFLDMLCSLWNPQPGTEPGPWTVKAQSADCWTDREVPKDVSVFLHFALLYFTATAFFFFLTNCRWHPCIQQVYVPTAFAHFMSLCHTVMILTIF